MIRRCPITTCRTFLLIFKEEVIMAQINAKAGPFQKPGLILLVALLLVDRKSVV